MIYKKRVVQPRQCAQTHCSHSLILLGNLVNVERYRVKFDEFS